MPGIDELLTAPARTFKARSGVRNQTGPLCPMGSTWCLIARGLT